VDVEGRASVTWSAADTDSSIPDRFAHVLERRPGHFAIDGGEERLTYAELGALAQNYAQACAHSSQPEGSGCCALLLEHGGGLLAAALGSLRGGRAVVTLNPSDPAARLAQIRDRTGPELLITDSDHVDLALAAGFDERQIVCDPVPSSHVACRCSPEDLAFLICTSGSTGAPKLVMQTHRNMLHNVLRYTDGLGLQPDDRIAWLASLAGGQGLATAWSALLNGATLCPFSVHSHGVIGLADWLEQQRITVFDTLPSILRSFDRTLSRGRTIQGVRLVRLASEPALHSDFEIYRRRFDDDCALASVLGCSEAGIIAQTLIAPNAHISDGGRLPVGGVADDIDVTLIDEAGAPAGVGEQGEIVVRSKYLSPGYWRDERLTATSFQAVDGITSYRTGDVARVNGDGSLTVVGRTDRQVKIRGHRLQLEEVEAALAAQTEVAAAAAVARRSTRGEVSVTAYVVPRPGANVAPARLRRSLRAILPSHAIPSAVVALDALALNPNGKLDRERLAELEPVEASREPGRSPVSETEELLASLWAAALGRDTVGLDDPFLELGGESLMAAEIAAGVYELFGFELDLDVFDAELTIARMAAQIDRRPISHADDSDELPPLQGAARSGPGPLSFAQETMWRQAPSKGAGFNASAAFRIRGPLDIVALNRALERIVRRHELLRTGFVERDGEPVAIVHPPAPLELELEDLSSHPDPESHANDLVAAEAHRPFDLGEPPLLRLRLLRLGQSEHWLLRAVHHIISDAPSWRIFVDELATLYSAFQEDRPSPLPEVPPLQFADYVEWERARISPGSPAYVAELDWWQRRLEPSPPAIALPFARPAPAEIASDAIGTVDHVLDQRSTAALDELGRGCGATYFMTRLAVFSALLGLETATEELAIDTYLTTRRSAALQGMMGPLINRAVLRLRCSAQLRVEDWLGVVRHEVVDLKRHGNIPFDRLLGDLRARGVRPPTLRIKFQAFYEVPPMSFAGLELEQLPRRQAHPWAFTLGVNRLPEGERWHAVFDPQIHDPAAVAAFLTRMHALAAAACAQPQQTLREIHASTSHASAWIATIRRVAARTGQERPAKPQPSLPRQRAAKPVPFIVGAPRSGTTMLRLMLDAHPNLAMPPETHFIPMLASVWQRASDPLGAALDALQAHERWPDFELDPESLRRPLGDIPNASLSEMLRAFYSAYAALHGKPRWGDKTPGYVMDMPLIAGILPEARFIHVIRDGRDVALSLLPLWFGPSTLEEAASLWDERVRTGRRDAPAVQYLEVRYERLVLDTRAELRRICDFVDLDFREQMLTYHDRAAARMSEMKDSAGASQRTTAAERAQMRSALRARLAMAPDTRSIERWRVEMSADWQRSFQVLAGELLEELGYPTSELKHAEHAPSSEDKAPTGRIESVAEGFVTGWAWCPAAPGRRLVVRVLLDGREAGSAVAELPRPSLVAAGIGDGRYGFRVQLPPRKAADGPHALRVETDTGVVLPRARGFRTVSSSPYVGDTE
jgi:acyl-coenzyme A synthetase/AMP-(fatty) acid ligase/acyl carrier protein